MRFKINDIGREGVAVSMPITADWLAAACPDVNARPGPEGLALRGRLSRSGDDYLLQGELRGSLQTTCARCLEVARLEIDTPLVVTYVPGDEVEEKIADEDPDTVVFAGGDLEIDDDVRDEILLSIPLGPLCSADCRGLCPVCGGNRNANPCDCEERERQAHSKFAVLAKLKS
jgi:uncharacterized metal-binding protein YceD (DUF177 family)